jgi:Fe-S oxidoreductase
MVEDGKQKSGRDFFAPYDAAACRACGDCLVKCPVMKLGRGDAEREIAALRAGKPGRFVRRRCESCMACNITCEQNAGPAMLFLDVFHKQIELHGRPAWSDYFQPHEENNFRNYVIRQLPADEKKMLEKWADTSPCEEFVYPGCNMCVTPYLTRAGFLSGLNIRGGPEYCCGEMYFRTGMFERLETQAKKLNGFVGKLGAKRMMILCTAGYNLFTNILPRHGFDADIEVTSYVSWLWERIEAGDIKITRKLDMTATIQESCHAKVFGPEYYDIPRKILGALGVEVIEMNESPECAMCCGIGGGFPAGSGYNPLDIARATLRVVHRAASTGAQAIVAYCSGCMQSMCSGMAVYPVKKPVYHLIQLLQMGVGEKPEIHLNKQRGALMMKGMLLNQSPMLLNPRRKR